ncbi:hypothetical protein LTS17_007997 [Exophiala oligosperma]
METTGSTTSNQQTNGHVVNGDAGPVDLDAVIIGGGFGGMYGLYKFRKLGLRVKLLEAAPYFGGTWYWNRYPGARVDSETPLYSLSIPEVYQGWTWSERFPGHEEIRRYFKHVDDVLSLSKDSLFDTVVVGASWDGTKWTVRTKSARVFRCRFLLAATGSSYKKYYPDFKGLQDYRGVLIHSAEYPVGGIETDNKRIAVVGNGATGIQIVSELGKTNCQLTAFVRTPSMTFPMAQRKLTVEEQENQKNFYDHLFASAKTAPVGFPYNHSPWPSVWDVSDEVREARFEYLWKQGGFVFQLSNFPDFLYDEKANALFYDFWRRKVRERVKTPYKADIVAPRKQHIFFGTKRASLEQDYYEVLDRPNVKLVNLKETPIKEFNETGIETSGAAGHQQLDFDVIILATGFDAVTGSLLDMGISDKDGKPLSETWRDGVRTHLGLALPNVPNLFMVYSPQAPTALSNGPPIIEYQVDWAVRAIQKMQTAEQGAIHAVYATPEAAEKWTDDIQAANEKTLFPRTDSWWMGANIPGKKRQQLMYINGLHEYIKACDAALDSWQGFQCVKE